MAQGVAVSVSFQDTVLCSNECARDRPAKCGTVPGNPGHVVTLAKGGGAAHTHTDREGVGKFIISLAQYGHIDNNLIWLLT